MTMRFIGWMGVLAVVTLAACTETVVVPSGDALVDPRFAPRVIYTSPPFNTVGPYAVWDDRGYYSSVYDVLVRFNKLMAYGSVRRGIQISSSLRAVRVDTGDTDPGVNDRYLFQLRDSIAGWYSPAPRIGEVFTLRAAAPLADVNGNLIPPGVIGTILPEPFFRVKMAHPAGGTKLAATTGGEIVLVFNSAVDQTIRDFIRVSPPIEGEWNMKRFDSTLVFLPLNSLASSSAYTVTVEAGARDKRGNVMPAPFAVSYAGQVFRHLVDYQLDDTVDVPLGMGYTIPFSLPVAQGSVGAAVRVSPDLGNTIAYATGGSFCRIEAVRDYDPLTRYTVAIDTTLRSTGGVWLEEALTFSFTTGPFGVTAVSPADGAAGAARRPGVSVSYTGRLDTATIRGAFHISPEAPGSFPFMSQENAIFFFPSDALAPLTTYTVTVDTTLRSQRGLRLEAPTTFSFTTRE